VLILLSFGLGVVNPTWTAPASADSRLASAAALRKHVVALTSMAPTRQYTSPEGLHAAAQYIRSVWASEGLAVESQPYQLDGRSYENLFVSFGPRAADRVVVGAHYDVYGDHPGADDNASGVAGLLELSRILHEQREPFSRRVDLVAFSTEEPPYFGGHEMGSWVHAKMLREQGVAVRAMLSLEMIGYFTDEPGSQQYPVPFFRLFYPSRGNFISLVGRFSDWELTRRAKPLMQAATSLPVYSANAPASIPGVDWSDHRSYWEAGFPALMITDTSFFRNRNYHESSDTPDTLDFDRMSQVVDGVAGMVRAL
jgi:hypothetical protein